MKSGGYFDTPEEARAFLKSLGLLKKTRVLEGEERAKVETMLRLIGPGEESNNQRFWTEQWKVGNVTYQHTTGQNVDELAEIIEEDV
jgi:ribosomal protein L30/L7E